MNKLTTDLLDVVAVLDLGEVARCTRCAREPSLRQARERGVPAQLAIMSLPSISYMKISRRKKSCLKCLELKILCERKFYGGKGILGLFSRGSTPRGLLGVGVCGSVQGS